jgi:hypothetical protein
MTTRLLAGTAILSFAASFAAPVAAQQIYYEDGEYFYAVPALVSAQDTVVSQPVEVPAPSYDVPVYDDEVSYDPMEPRIAARRVIPSRDATAERTVPQIILPAPQPTYAYPAYLPATYAQAPQGQTGYVVASRSIPANGYAYAAAPQHYGYVAQAPQPGYLPGGGQLVSFDRNAWLAECSARLNTYEDSDRGQVLSGLIGAAAGGLIGNRIAGSGDRLGGTLIGAGTGALAGLAVGDAIDDRNDARGTRSAYDQCRAYLDDYMNRASNHPAPTTTVPGQQYMLVPVSVPVAQQAVYREYVVAEPQL